MIEPPDDPITMIANCLSLYCGRWIEYHSDDLEAAASVIVAYLAGAGYHIQHENEQVQLALETGRKADALGTGKTDDDQRRNGRTSVRDATQDDRERG